MIQLNAFHLFKVASGDIKIELEFCSTYDSEMKEFKSFLRHEYDKKVDFLGDGGNTIIVSLIIPLSEKEFFYEIVKIKNLPREFNEFIDTEKYIEVAECVLERKHSKERLLR